MIIFDRPTMPRQICRPLGMVLWAVLVSICIIGGSDARAVTILARCGPSLGQSYYFEAGVVGPGRGGWQKDGFDNGRITAFINDSGQIDLLQRDSTGVRSYLKEGYKVGLVKFSKEDRAFLLTAYGDAFTET